MRTQYLLPIAAAAVVALAGPAQAMTMADAFEAARGFDPQYRAASHELASTRQGVPIARSSFYPQLGFNAANTSVTGSRQFPNALGQEVTTRVDYNAPSQSISLRQPLFNYESIGRLRQAEAQTEVAESTFRQRGLELVDRVGTAYVQALLARTALELAQTEVASYQAQLERAQQRFSRGEGTRIDEAQARAALELAKYRLVDARDQIAVAVNRLRRLTGMEPGWLRGLGESFQPNALVPASLQEWLDMAVDQSPALQARRQTVDVARANVQRNQAGHMPRVDLVASLGRSSNESISNLNQSSKLASAGFQISVPLFSGGGVAASVRQAESDRSRTEEELRNERENLELEVQRLYLAVVNGVARIEAQRNVVSANQTALQGVSRALDAGLATSADVLEARSRVFSAQRELAQARYEYLVARMRLMATSGVAMQRVVDDLDQMLTEKTELQSRRAP